MNRTNSERSYRRRSKTNGFTIIELLVVLAIVAIFLAVLGLALTGGDRGTATAAAQRTLSGLVSGARGQAILKGEGARLIINNDPDDPERYLRYMTIVVRDPSVAGGWRAVNDGSFLPTGIYVVQPKEVDPATVRTNLFPQRWPDEVRTILPVDPNTGFTQSMKFALDGTTNEREYIFVSFNWRGGTASTATIPPGIGGTTYDTRLILAPAEVTPSGPAFEEDGEFQARGGVLRSQGTLLLVNDSIGFPKGQ